MEMQMAPLFLLIFRATQLQQPDFVEGTVDDAASLYLYSGASDRWKLAARSY